MAKSWDKTDAPKSGNSQDIVRLRLGDKTKIRLVGDVEARYVYWITTNEGKKRPVECLGFDRETETFLDSLPNPMADVPDNIFNDKPQFAYVCNIIDREDNTIKLFDIKKTIYNQIIQLAQDPEWGNPADDKKGYDITITKEKTGPLPQNVKYTCLPGNGSKPLTAKEKEMQLYDLPVILKRSTAEEQKEWLIKNTSFFIGAENQDLAPQETAEDL